MALIIDNEKKVLLLHSEVTKKFDWFLDFLENNERITDKLVSILPKDKQNFIEHDVPVIIKQAIEEWERDLSKPVEDKGPGHIAECRANWLNCTLSGTPNRRIYYIVNKLNGNSLNVGSECVNDFVSRKEQRELERTATKVFFLSKLNEQFPGIANMVNEWDKVLDKYSLMVPSRLEDPYIELGRRVKEVYDKFLNEQNKVDYEHFTAIASLLEERNILLQSIEQYMHENKNFDDIPTREMEQWLREQRTPEAQKALLQLKDDGKITLFSSYRIREKNYMKSLVPKLNLLLKEVKFTVQDANTDKETYIVTPSSNKQAKLNCKHKALLTIYGGMIYGDEQISPRISDIIEICSIEDEETIYFVEQRVRSILKKSGQEYIDSSFEFNEIILKQRSGKYIVVKLKEFTNSFKHLAFHSGEQQNEDLFSFIENYSPSFALKYMKDMETPRWKYGKR